MLLANLLKDCHLSANRISKQGFTTCRGYKKLLQSERIDKHYSIYEALYHTRENILDIIKGLDSGYSYDIFAKIRGTGVKANMFIDKRISYEYQVENLNKKHRDITAAKLYYIVNKIDLFLNSNSRM